MAHWNMLHHDLDGELTDYFIVLSNFAKLTSHNESGISDLEMILTSLSTNVRREYP